MNEIFLYKLFLSLHIISVIAWMAGMLYLPRLFVYHSTKPVGSDSSETFKIMERKLLNLIINPAAIFSYIWLCVNTFDWGRKSRTNLATAKNSLSFGHVRFAWIFF